MVSASVRGLFSADRYMPHGASLLWQPGALTLHIASDGLTALAYLSIAFTLAYFLRKHADSRVRWIFLCFALIVVAGALTHLVSIWTIRHPAHWLSGGITAVTALAAVFTAIVLLKLVQEAPQRDTAHFEIAADAANLGLWEFDVAANVLRWDERMYRLYGFPPSASDAPFVLATGRMHPEDCGRCERERTAAIARGQPYDTEFRIVHPNGSVRHLRTAAGFTHGADGRALRMFGLTFDVTEQKRADEWFRLAAEAAPTGMLLADHTGSIVFVNAQIENLFGYRREELLGQKVEVLVPVRFRELHPALRREFLDAPKSRPLGAGRDLSGLRKDGSEVPIEIGLNRLHTAEGEFVVSSIVDLSQRREMARLQTDLLSTVSHELRTPLTSISGSLGLLQSNAMGKLPDKAAAMVRIAYKNSLRLIRISNDILDIGRLEAGILEFRPTDISLSELLKQAIEANAGYADEFQVRFTLDAGPGDDRVTADSDRLIQVITNLLSNAVKFSPAGGEVRVRIRPAAAMVRVEVEDSGPGIPEKFRSHIFEKFAQADASTTRRFKGTGLGLSIARKLIEAMGGTIGYISEPGQGAIFHFALPRTDAAPPIY